MCLEVANSSHAIANRPGMSAGARDDSMDDDALTKARALQVEAAGLGFDWPDIAGVFDKLHEEIAELRRVALEISEPEPGFFTTS